MPTCSDCRFFHETRAPQFEGGDAEGQCRIRSTAGGFPYRSSSDWCGERVPRPGYAAGVALPPALMGAATAD